MLEMMYSIESLRSQVKEKGHRFILAKGSEKTFGYASYEISYIHQTTKLHKIYVLPDCQGLNIGAKLLQTVETKAKEAGDSFLRLNVNRDNNAVGFYKKKGFKVLYDEDIDIGNGYYMNDYVMQKELISYCAKTE